MTLMSLSLLKVTKSLLYSINTLENGASPFILLLSHLVNASHFFQLLLDLNQTFHDLNYLIN